MMSWQQKEDKTEYEEQGIRQSVFEGFPDPYMG